MKEEKDNKVDFLEIDPTSPGWHLAAALTHHKRESNFIHNIIRMHGTKAFDPYCPQGTTALMKAAEMGSRHLQMLVSLAPAKVLSSADIEGLTPMHYAARGGANNAIEILHRAGANTNSVARGGELPIHAAARRGHVGTARLLNKQFGTSLSAETESGETPLLIAARAGHEPFVRSLLELLPDEDARVRELNRCAVGSSEMPIRAACAHLPVLWLLVNSGFINTPAREWIQDVQAKDRDQLKAWIQAALQSLTSQPMTSQTEQKRHIMLNDLALLLTSPPCSDDEPIDDGDCDY